MPYTDNHHAHITQLYRELAQFAAGFIPAKIPLEPTRGEVLATIDDLRALARKVDVIIECTAQYVEDSAGYSIDVDCSADQLSKALDGYLIYEIECAADEARERLLGVA